MQLVLFLLLFVFFFVFKPCNVIFDYFVLGMQHTWHVHSAFLAKNSLIFAVIFNTNIFCLEFTM